MKLFRGLLGLAVAVVAAGAVVWFVPALRVPADIWVIDSGVVPLDYADWAYLRESSGDRGREALKTLARHGSSDDIRITADYMLNDYIPPDRCGDSTCAKPLPTRIYHPVATALQMVTDLRPGQVLPHEFVIQTANDRKLHQCIHMSPDCVLRMQDINGDGKDEVVVEETLRDGRDGPEDEARHLLVYCEDKDEWMLCERLNFRNYDARTWPQRPFIVETIAMDDLVVNGTSFHFVNHPHYAYWPEHPNYAASQMKGLGVFAGRVPVVLPKDGRVPADLIAALRSGTVTLTPLTGNPPLPTPPVTKGPWIDYTRPPLCQDATTCRAIVADLDHDGHDDVILIGDPDPADAQRPFDATLLKNEGGTWRVMANIELCRDIVPDIAKAKFELVAAKHSIIRLGENRYPLEWNPGCAQGYVL